MLFFPSGSSVRPGDGQEYFGGGSTYFSLSSLPFIVREGYSQKSRVFYLVNNSVSFHRSG